MTIANKLARAELVDMVPYQSARRLFASGDLSNNTNASANKKIWLNANEAPGNGEYQVTSENINRYPDFQPDNLLNAYSNYCGLERSQILATRGADEGIELIIRSFCRAYQDSILICPPTYGMYAISAENHGAGIVKVPLKNNILDLESMKSQVGKVKVVFLCSPGNPTGNLLPKEQIVQAIELFKDTAIVVLDEAYIEFSPEQTSTTLLAQYENVIVLRTLSKAFALAGLRCGFTLASNDIITLLSKVIAPYPVSAPVAEIASLALSTDLTKMTQRVQDCNTLKAELTIWLNEQSWCSEVFASDANFVLFRCTTQQEKTQIFDLLVSKNILIRDQSKQLQLDNCLRISIGSEQEITQLKEVLS
ncbi:histidinol-phosphate transaminase [Colwellia sp. 1_MG-2023]|jgi:histidinol-phosphate aminotransferase|uniref:histidinol-phosphate transaminase n=1 Tax=unclassified Colwellia TaxID=196834 RepID=UPI001C09B05B|nr:MULTISPECIES: histidinol-phosphate transaminase [unclassified Colwellia]MBU2925647.1 histidinol-phosphate transaminase [Colwellia sp. C2M11]MDO6651127.1 histidinol-phosphate transaminase [Colwellia sp. 3_MG-2023]MDO6666421.1 histidinol-phosphate transaminase [Colwellia sp. 2_MG-2023]MDO6690715.1 histidinol-phosphate transaminase [Colwellia sp. 1_MG-2023]